MRLDGLDLVVLVMMAAFAGACGGPRGAPAAAGPLAPPSAAGPSFDAGGAAPIADAGAPVAVVEGGVARPGACAPGDIVHEGQCRPLHCDSPRVRDVLTLECVDRPECPPGQELVAGACAHRCDTLRTHRDPALGHACSCPPGTQWFGGDEIAGCVKPGQSIMPDCSRPHEHLDASMVPRCECDPGFVHAGGATIFAYDCIRACRAPDGYAPRSGSCRACTAREDRVGPLCVPRCTPGTTRNRATGECDCPAGQWQDDAGRCVRCLPGRTWSDATQACACPAGTDDAGGFGCLPACAGGQHRLGRQCVPDCPPPLLNDSDGGACRTCDPSLGALAAGAVCVQCSFDEVLGPGRTCTCRDGFRPSNGHCVRGP
jgi:hypothetical protein